MEKTKEACKDASYEKLIKLLKIENQEFEKEILSKWIERNGIKEVYNECLKIIEKYRKNKELDRR